MCVCVCVCVSTSKIAQQVEHNKGLASKPIRRGCQTPPDNQSHKVNYMDQGQSSTMRKQEWLIVSKKEGFVVAAEFSFCDGPI